MNNNEPSQYPQPNRPAEIADKPVLTTEQASIYLQTSKRQLQELAYQRQIAYVKFGRLVRFRKSDLDDFLERRLVAPFK